MQKKQNLKSNEKNLLIKLSTLCYSNKTFLSTIQKTSFQQLPLDVKNIVAKMFIKLDSLFDFSLVSFFIHW